MQTLSRVRTKSPQNHTRSSNSGSQKRPAGNASPWNSTRRRSTPATMALHGMSSDPMSANLISKKLARFSKAQSRGRWQMNKRRQEERGKTLHARHHGTPRDEEGQRLEHQNRSRQKRYIVSISPACNNGTETVVMAGELDKVLRLERKHCPLRGAKAESKKKKGARGSAPGTCLGEMGDRHASAKLGEREGREKYCHEGATTPPLSPPPRSPPPPHTHKRNTGQGKTQDDASKKQPRDGFRSS